MSLPPIAAVHSAMTYTPIGALSPASAKVQRDRTAARVRKSWAAKKAAGLTVQSGMSEEAQAIRKGAAHQLPQICKRQPVGCFWCWSMPRCLGPLPRAGG